MDQFFEQLHGWINAINDPMWSGLVYMLLGAGLFFTVTTGFVLFPSNQFQILAIPVGCR